MAAFPRKRFPFTFQPPFLAQIDINNPLCKGLVDVAIPINGSVVSPSIVTGQGNTLWADTSSPSSSLHARWGNTKLYNGSTNYSSRSATPPPFNAASSSLKECSILVLWRTRGATAATTFACGYGSSASNNPIFALGIDASNTHFTFFLRDTAGASQSTSGAASIAASTDYVIVGTRSETNNFHRIYVNGTQDLSTTTTALGSVSFDRAAVGGLLRNTFGLTAGGNIGLMLVWNRALSPLETTLLYQNPWQIFEVPQPLILINSAGGGGDVTVAATGVSAIGAAGNVSPAIDVPLTGVSATGTAGNIAGTGQDISGVQGTGSAGTVVPNISVALTGVSATGQVGNVSIAGDVTVAVTGVQATGQVGNVTASVPVIIDDTHDGDWHKKRYEEERRRRLQRKEQVIAAYEQIIEGKVQPPPEVKKIIAPYISRKATLTLPPKVDFDRLIKDLERTQALLDYALERDDEDVLMLI